MQNDDKAFQDLLSIYSAPAKDDGFSQAVVQSIDIAALQAAQAREDKLRLYSLFGAAFMGGIIAAFQLPSLMKLLDRFTVAALDIPVLPNSTFSDINVLVVSLIFAIAIWAMVDSKASDIF